MHEIKAIIFDMDGVLIDAKEWHYEALNRALGLFGFSINRYDHLITYDGLPTREKLKMLSLDQQLPEGLHHFINQMKQIYTQELIHTRCKPTFQHEYALSRLQKQKYKLALASNSVRNSIELMLTRCSLYHYFEVVLSNEDVTQAKPHPEIYTKAISLLNLQPTECVVIEDNQHGIQAAKMAGAHVLAVKSVNDVTLDHITSFIQQCSRATVTS